MKPKVAKVLVSVLRNSKIYIATLMAGKAPNSHYKLLTESQVIQLNRYGIETIPLTDEEKSVYSKEIIRKKPKKKKETIDDYPSLFSEPKKDTVIVTYEDEDGENEIKFNSESGANEWIKYQESRKCSGEKFNVISIKHEND